VIIFIKNERGNKQSIYLKRDNKHANKQSIKGRNGVIAKTTWGAIYIEDMSSRFLHLMNFPFSLLIAWMCVMCYKKNPMAEIRSPNY
jgi:hypothetical protein